MAKKINTKIRSIPSALSQNQRVTRRELYLVKNELQSEFKTTHSLIEQRSAETNAKMHEYFSKMELRFAGLDSKFSKSDERTSRIESRLDKMDARFERIEARLDAMDARFDRIEARLDAMDARLDAMDARFAQIDVRFAQIDARFADMDVKFSRLETKIDKISSDLSRALILFEEQRQDNRIALEGHQLLWQHQSEDYSKIKRTLHVHGIELE